MRKMMSVLIAAATAGIAGVMPVNAAETNGYKLIVLGNYSAAEREIAQERRLFPHDADLLINLATVYLRTGRVAAARDIYYDVLARPNEELDLPQQGSSWSHTIAASALQRLDPVTISFR
jgi:Flp pilus assembly protein TadD